MPNTQHIPAARALCLASLLVAAGATQALAQRSRPTPDVDPKQTTRPAVPIQAPGAKPGVATPEPLDIPSPFLTLADHKRWTLSVRVGIRQLDMVDDKGMPTEKAWRFDEATFVFPALDRTASSRADGDEPAGSVRMQGVETTDAPTLRPNMNCGARFAYFHVPAGEPKAMELTLTLASICSSTTFDEASASQVPWPAGPWPAVAQSTFEPQAWQDYGPPPEARRGGPFQPYDHADIDAMLHQWLDKKDPKSLRPVVLAKTITGKLQEHIQISGTGLSSNKNGELEGFDLKAPVRTLAEARGSGFDAASTLTLLFRRAGLPARLVIGLQADEGGEFFLEGRGNNETLHAWTEFALWDEATQTLTWVPVDIARLRKAGSRAKPIDRPWQNFGTIKELSRTVPIAHHFHPPPPITTRAYGSPAMYGLFFLPEAPAAASQYIHISAMSTPQRGSDRPRDR